MGIQQITRSYSRYSKPIIVQYIISLSRNSSWPLNLAENLADVGLSPTLNTINFAEEVFCRIPPKLPGGLNPYRQEEREKIKLVKKQRLYKIIEVKDYDDDDFEEKNDRKTEALLDVIEKGNCRILKMKEEMYASDERVGKIEILRRDSRRDYLKKREKRKIEALLDEIEDEHRLFDKTNLLTEKEKKNLQANEELYSVVQRRTRDDDVDEYKGYVIPEAYDQEGRIDQEKRFAVVKDKYREDCIKNSRSEQTGWEDAQLKRGEVGFGAKNRKLVICVRMRRG